MEASEKDVIKMFFLILMWFNKTVQYKKSNINKSVLYSPPMEQMMTSQQPMTSGSSQGDCEFQPSNPRYGMDAEMSPMAMMNSYLMTGNMVDYNQAFGQWANSPDPTNPAALLAAAGGERRIMQGLHTILPQDIYGMIVLCVNSIITRIVK